MFKCKTRYGRLSFQYIMLLGVQTEWVIIAEIQTRICTVLQAFCFSLHPPGWGPGGLYLSISPSLKEVKHDVEGRLCDMT